MKNAKKEKSNIEIVINSLGVLLIGFLHLSIFYFWVVASALAHK